MSQGLQPTSQLVCISTDRRGPSGERLGTSGITFLTPQLRQKSGFDSVMEPNFTLQL